MNAAMRRPTPEIEPCRLVPSAAAQRRLARRLGREHPFDEVLAVSALYGVDPRALAELYRYWQDELELEQQPLFRLPSFQLRQGNDTLRFVHVRSPSPAALPLLLLHGSTAALPEVAGLAPALAEPTPGAPAFHVVCPALDDAGGTRALLAERCHELMHSLGYSRYLVHGSDSGAAIALELAAREPDAVVGAHVTCVAAYPHEASEPALSQREKSQLAALTELYQRLEAELPENPLEELAFALSRLADSPEPPSRSSWRDTLLTGLSLSCLDERASERRARYRELRLAPSRASRAPLSVHCFPLDGPSLRRFVEAEHRVAEWHEHERGGPCPALEQPELLVASLRQFGARSS